MSRYVVESFTNEFGQVINPGDDIIYISSSAKIITVKEGTFSGVFYDRDRQNKEYICSVRVDNVDAEKWDKDLKDYKKVKTHAVLFNMRVYKIDKTCIEKKT